MEKRSLILASAALLLFFVAIPTRNVFAAKSPTPRITEIAGIYTPNIRVHFQLNPIKAGQIIKVRYSLSTKKFNDVKYEIPKNAKRSGTVNAAASATGSAIDLYNLPTSLGKFIYNIKVQVAIPGKAWSSWSNAYSI